MSRGVHANGMSLVSDFKTTKPESGKEILFQKIPKISVTKTRPVGVQIFHEDGRTDKTKTKSRFSQLFCE
jgi:hypothetical protein